MKCIYCGYDVEDNETACGICGRDLRVYKKILMASDICYNEGLKKAKARDLSGAIDSLVKSLKYNKYNILSRNLLGLVYFEIGEQANALNEWVISKNFQPYDNRADYYLEEISGNPSLLNRIDNITKKYNQVLVNIRQGDYDLATITLKRIVADNSNMIKARSLLALLYINAKKYKLARKELLLASKIDTGNPDINIYLKEVEMQLEMDRQASLRRSKKKSDEEEYDARVGNTATFIMDYSKVSVVNIIIGVVVGLMASVFLIFPAMRQRQNNDALNAFLIANEDIRSSENNLSSKQEQIDALTEELENYKGKADIKESYENLTAALTAFYERDYDTAVMHYDNINRDVLNPTGAGTYDNLAQTLETYKIERAYAAARRAYDEEDYATAIASYTIVVDKLEDYDNGNAIYNLGRSFELSGDIENAVRIYNRAAELFEDRNIGRKSQERIRELQP